MLTSRAKNGDSGEKTAVSLGKSFTPCYTLKSTEERIAPSPHPGGHSPLDPLSNLPERATPSTKRFHEDLAAQAELASTKPLADVSASNFNAVFYPGGRGPMWDMPNNTASIALIEAFIKDDKPVVAICHGPIALVNVRGKNCDYLVRGKRVAGFSNDEEKPRGLNQILPLLPEKKVEGKGRYTPNPQNYPPHTHGQPHYHTPQNPLSPPPTTNAPQKSRRTPRKTRHSIRYSTNAPPPHIPGALSRRVCSRENVHASHLTRRGH